MLKSPYPWPGGKSDVAAEIWRRFGNPGNYVEPFAGSAAALFLRPDEPQTETLNDLDGFIVNALRSIAYAPDETAAWCDWPVSEADLTAIHLWLKAQRDDLVAHLCADPDYCDPKIAGRWLWGIASWIGDGWCVADGPWINLDGRLVDRRTLPEDEQNEGVWKQAPAITPQGNGGERTQGIQRYRGVPRKMPEVGKSPNGQIGFNRKGIQAVRHAGVRKKMPSLDHEREMQSLCLSPALRSYFTHLSERLRRVRFLCGDWRRAVKDSITVNHGLTGMFLDPEYPTGEHAVRYHRESEREVWFDAAEWAIVRGDDPRLRICIAGYFSEEVDALFPATWDRFRWAARGGYSNQAKDGRGRANAKRECLWFSPHCLNGIEALPLFAQPGNEPA